MMKKLIIANWKMNPQSQKEAKKLFSGVLQASKGENKVEVVVCCPFVYLPLALEFSCGRKKIQVRWGAQDCFFEEKGAFTGEISPFQLRDLNVRYVLCGHSERRGLGEDDEVVNQKLKAILAAGLCPILCVGERAEEREKRVAFRVLEKQVRVGLKGVAKNKIGKVVIAYEPVWAISPGGPCQPDDALTASLFVRKIISQIAGKKTAKGLKVLYGGSVDPQNIEDFIQGDWFQGALVGAASLDVREFAGIIKRAQLG